MFALSAVHSSAEEGPHTTFEIPTQDRSSYDLWIRHYEFPTVTQSLPRKEHLTAMYLDFYSKVSKAE